MKNSRFLVLLILAHGVLVLPIAAVTVTNLLYSGNGSLGEAVATTPPGGTVTFDASLDGGTIFLGGSEIVISKDLTIDASNLPNGITLDAEEQSRIFRIFLAPGSGDIEIRGLTLTRGKSGSGFDGGAIWNSATLTLRDCDFVRNTASHYRGGAIFNESSLTLIDCEFTDNFAGDSGGAIYSRDSIVLTDCIFKSNESGSGGAILSAGIPNLTMTGCRFLSNSATYGGAYCGTGGIMTVTDCYFWGNYTLDGGAIIGGADTTTYHECVFTRNSASSGGGAISNVTIRTEMTNCLLSQNIAYGGGAILHSSGQLTMTNCTLSANLDTFGGGAIWNDDTLILKNGILWGNGTEVGGLAISGSSSNNLIEGEPGATDPLFADPASDDFRLQFGSPAIGAGNNADNTRPSDLDGTARILETIDLGAYETSFPDPTVMSTWAADQGLTYAQSLASADADGDGRTTLEEFAFGLDPQDPSDGPVFARKISGEGGNEYFTLTIPTRNGAVFAGSPHPTARVDGITYVIEGSTDMQDYSASVEFIGFENALPAPAGWTMTTFRLMSDPSVERSGFLRVKIAE